MQTDKTKQSLSDIYPILTGNKSSAATDSRTVAGKSPILTCNGAFRKQAFRRGSHIIGYGKTEEEAIADMKRKLQSLKP